MPLKRLRQIVAAITERKIREQEESRSVVNWSTKTLAHFIAAAAPMAGKDNPLLKVAGQVDIAGKEPEEAEVPAENAPGSYERFMLALGSGDRR